MYMYNYHSEITGLPLAVLGIPWCITLDHRGSNMHALPVPSLNTYKYILAGKIVTYLKKPLIH